jgi:hypothetical protein
MSRERFPNFFRLRLVYFRTLCVVLICSGLSRLQRPFGLWTLRISACLGSIEEFGYLVRTFISRTRRAKKFCFQFDSSYFFLVANPISSFYFSVLHFSSNFFDAFYAAADLARSVLLSDLGG